MRFSYCFLLPFERLFLTEYQNSLYSYFDNRWNVFCFFKIIIVYLERPEKPWKFKFQKSNIFRSMRNLSKFASSECKIELVKWNILNHVKKHGHTAPLRGVYFYWASELQPKIHHVLSSCLTKVPPNFATLYQMEQAHTYT